MSTNHHTPIINNDPRKNDASIWNDPLEELDQAITDGDAGETAQDARLDALEANDVSQDADIAANDADIAANTAKNVTQDGRLDDLETNDTVQDAAIAENTSDVSQNTLDIGAQGVQIAENASNIAGNVTDISKNTAQIQTHEADMITQQQATAALQSDVDDMEADVAKNTNDIAALAIASNGVPLTYASGTQTTSTTLVVVDGTDFPDGTNINYLNGLGQLEYRTIVSGGGTNTWTLDQAHTGVNDQERLTGISTGEYMARPIFMLGATLTHPMTEGAVGDGVTDDSVILDTIANTTMGGRGELIIDRVYKVGAALGSTLVIPEGVTIRGTEEGGFDVDTGVNLQIDGNLEIGNGQFFTQVDIGSVRFGGSGTRSKLDEVLVDWWGTDLHALNCATYGGIKHSAGISRARLLGDRTYTINGQFVVPASDFTLSSYGSKGGVETTGGQLTTLDFIHADGKHCIFRGNNELKEGEVVIEPAALDAEGTAYAGEQMRLDGFMVQGNSSTGDGIHLYRSGAWQEMRNLVVRDCGGNGIHLNYSHLGIMSNVTCRNNDGVGFWMEAANAWTMDRIAARYNKGFTQFNLDSHSNRISGDFSYAEENKGDTPITIKGFGNHVVAYTEKSSVGPEIQAGSFGNYLQNSNTYKVVVRDNGTDTMTLSRGTGTFYRPPEPWGTVESTTNLFPNSAFSHTLANYLPAGTIDHTTGVSTSSSLTYQYPALALSDSFNSNPLFSASTGDKIYFSFWAKADREVFGGYIGTTAENEYGKVEAVTAGMASTGAGAGSPISGWINDLSLHLTTEWRQFRFYGEVDYDGTLASIRINFKATHVGATPLNFWVTDIHVSLNPNVDRPNYVRTNEAALTYANTSIVPSTLQMTPMSRPPFWDNTLGEEILPPVGTLAVSDQDNWALPGVTTPSLLFYDGVAWRNLSRAIMPRTNGTRVVLNVVASAITLDGFSSNYGITDNGAGAVNLETINGMSDGDIIVIRPEATSATITVKHGVGNIRLSGGVDWAMNSRYKTLWLHKDSQNGIIEMSRSDNTVV